MLSMKKLSFLYSQVRDDNIKEITETDVDHFEALSKVSYLYN